MKITKLTDTYYDSDYPNGCVFNNCRAIFGNYYRT